MSSPQEPQGPKGEGVKKPPGKTPAVRTKLAQQEKGTVVKPKVETQGKVIRNDRPNEIPPTGTQAELMETVAIPEPKKEPGKTKLPPPAGKTIASPKVASTQLGGGNPVAPGGEKAASMLGDYKLLKKVGQGGMGTVYKARKVGEEQIVAIKVLSKELSSKETFVLRFQREGRVMRKLDHPNVLRCFDVGQSKNYHYFTMEFVEGGSIEAWLKKLGRFSVGDALHIILKVAEGLQHAHDMSLIHRDIKPDNILLTSDGIVKIADLGLAKDTDESTSLTRTGAGAGTPIFMAPEQARDVKHVDNRVDIYALGVMLYVFLTGQPPFAGATYVDVIGAKEKGKFDPIRRHNTDVPPKLDLIVDKMMAKDPKHRYASCGDVIAALEPLGLANEHLTFVGPPPEELGAEDMTNPVINRPERPAAPAKKPTQLAGKPQNKTTGPGIAARNTNIAAPEPVEKDVWYWQIKTPGGKTVTRKVTTNQIKTLIKSDSIGADAQISQKEKVGFRAIASFPEFESLFATKETTGKARARTKKNDDIYKEIERADARKRKWGWLTRAFKGFGGFLIGTFWIALIMMLVGLTGWFVYTYFLR